MYGILYIRPCKLFNDSYKEEVYLFMNFPKKEKMENILILLACVVMTTAAGNYKLFKMEKTEKVKVREFEMGTKELDKTLSRKLYETRGNVTNCDDTKTKFSVQWSPLTLNIQGVVTLYWDFVTPNEMDKGNIHLDVFLSQSPDTLMFSFDQAGSCGDLKRSMPSLVCPIKANTELKGTIPFSDLTRFPTGNYIIVVKLTNDKHQPCFCGKTTIQIS